jgi:hypothetical protein
MNGFKFLDASGATHRNGIETVYPLPAPGEKWGPEFIHPDPAEPDGNDCGPGRWHVMKKPNARYAPPNWWPWYVRSTGTVLGDSNEKYGTTALQLRRISPRTWHRMIRLGWCSGAELTGSYLYGADLTGANLYGADLYGANLTGADLTGANLTGANLYGADLRRAELTGADHNYSTQWPPSFDFESAVVADMEPPDDLSLAGRDWLYYAGIYTLDDWLLSWRIEHEQLTSSD